MIDYTDDLENQYADAWINNDSPEIQFIEVEDDNSGDITIPAALFVTMDTFEAPVFHAYDLTSIDYLIDAALEAKDTLIEMGKDCA